MASVDRRRLLSITGTITAASFLGALRPVRVARAAGAPAWSVKGIQMYGCPCQVSCDCDFGTPPSAGFCTVVIAYHIDSGRYGDASLDGLNAVRMFHSPGDMANGNFRIAFYLDERANTAQREALSAIFSIKPGGAFAARAKKVAQDLGVRFVPISIDTSGRQRKFSVSGIAGADVAAIIGRDDKEIVVDNLEDEIGPFVIGRSSRTTYKDYDIQLDVSGRSGGWSRFALRST